MLLLFCVAGHSGANSRQLQELSVTASRVSGLVMTWFRLEPLKVLTASVDDNWRQIVAPLDYSELLCTLHAEQDFIPMRYGSLLADDKALGRWLKKNTPALLSQLERLRGGVEMTVLLPDQGATNTARRIQAATKEKTGLKKGAAYLQARRNKYVYFRNNETLLLLKAEVAGLYKRCTVEPVRYAGQSLVGIHFLVPRARIKSFQQCLSRLLERHPGWISRGPSPPFSFLSG